MMNTKLRRKAGRKEKGQKEREKKETLCLYLHDEFWIPQK